MHMNENANSSRRHPERILIKNVAICLQINTFICLFAFSYLQLEDDIHLSLSPTTSPIPDEAVFDDVDLNSSSKSVTEVPAGLSKYAVGYRDVRSAPGRPNSSWYEGILGCLKPVMSFMNKAGKPANLQKDSKGKNRKKYDRF